MWFSLQGGREQRKVSKGTAVKNLRVFVSETKRIHGQLHSKVCILLPPAQSSGELEQVLFPVPGPGVCIILYKAPSSELRYHLGSI